MFISDENGVAHFLSVIRKCVDFSMLYWYICISMDFGANVYRCCVLFIMIHLVPTMIHKSTGMCIMVALCCCINIYCMSKHLLMKPELVVLGVIGCVCVPYSKFTK